ncbi:MAG: SdrD B-like domain-containing protein [Blastocatellia bacterium]
MKLTDRFLLILFITLTTAAIGFNRGEALVAANLAPHPAPIDLSLTKLVGPRPLGGFRVGSQVVYHLTVRNASDCKREDSATNNCASATNVQVKDVLPSGLTYVSSNPPYNYNPQSGIWSIAKLEAGDDLTLQIVATINKDAGDRITNYAQVWRATPEDIDSTPGNNSEEEDDNAVATINLVTAASSLAGNVYVDSNDDGERDRGEEGIGGVKITLSGKDINGNNVLLTTNTQSNGSYIFDDLQAGTYKVAESQPPEFLDGKDTAGSAGGTVANDLISNIYLRSGVAAVGYNFGEQVGAVDLAIAKSHTGNFTAGATGIYTLTITNVGGMTAAGGINVVDTLPSGLSFVSGAGDGWVCSEEADRRVVCDRPASLDPGDSTNITLRVRVATRILSRVVNTATVSTPGDIDSTNNTARDTTIINTTPPPPVPEPCETDGASVLLFPLYASGAVNSERENTRITITTTNQNDAVVAHLFFVDGASCSVSDAFVCLTENQTVSFLASDLDPGTTGYMVVVAVDNEGCPTSFNHLIGQGDVRLATGHTGSYLAEKFPALYTGRLPGCDSSSTTATLGLDGVLYGQPASQLAVPMIPSLADGNNPLLTLVRVGGDLATGASRLGSIVGLLYNDQENSFSFSISSGSCQLKQALSEDFPRTAPRITTVIPSGRTGWMRLGPNSGNGIAGLFFNTNTNQSNLGSVFSVCVSLPKLRCGVDSYTIPVFGPSCQ